MGINNSTEKEWDSLDRIVKDFNMFVPIKKEHSDGASADYYTFPNDFSELQDLISYKNMNAQIGEIFRACYRYGEVSHSPPIRDIKKIIFYAKAELARLQRIEDHGN